MSDTQPVLAFVGTYTDDCDSDGLYSFHVDPESGFDRLGTTPAGENPFYQAIHPGGEYLYSLEMADEGRIRAFSIDRETGDLSPLNSRSTGDQGPCHLSLDSTGQYAVVANYTGGSVSLHPIEDDGHIGESRDFVVHEGSSVDPERQTEPHPHSITFGPDDRYAYAADLGTDEIIVYEIDRDAGKLAPVQNVAVQPGAGPRHVAFHPDENVLYVINELDSTLTTFERNLATGAIEPLERRSTLPDGFDGENFAADVRVDPTGQWVYGSNRGHDSIVCYELGPATGRPDGVEHVSAGGEWPWNLTFSPEGSHLIVSNHDSDEVRFVRIDPERGERRPMEHGVEVPRPVCTTVLSPDL